MAEHPNAPRLFLQALGGRIRAARLEASRSQGWLAEQAGLSRISIVRIETGQQAPSVLHLAAIAGALQAPLRRLLPDEGQ